MRTALCYLLFALNGWGQAAGERPEIGVPFTSEAVPSEAAWAKAAWIPSLAAPSNAQETGPIAATEVGLLWHPDALWVRFRCREEAALPAPDREGETPLHSGDCVEIFLDPVGDGRVFAELQFDAKGRIFDALHLYTAPPESNADLTIRSEVIDREGWFFPGWQLEGVRSEPIAIEGGWQVTIALPARPLLKRLGLGQFQGGRLLRANFVRLDYTTPEGKPIISNWGPVVAGRVHRSPEGMGRLRLLAPSAAQ